MSQCTTQNQPQPRSVFFEKVYAHQIESHSTWTTYQLEFAQIFHDSFWGILPKSLQNHLKILQNHPRSPQNHIQIFSVYSVRDWQVINLELMPQPPKSRSPNNPWPHWPLVFKAKSSDGFLWKISGATKITSCFQGVKRGSKYMDVSKNRGTPKTPQNDHFSRKTHGFWYHHFRNPPHEKFLKEKKSEGFVV